MEKVQKSRAGGSGEEAWKQESGGKGGREQSQAKKGGEKPGDGTSKTAHNQGKSH